MSHYMDPAHDGERTSTCGAHPVCDGLSCAGLIKDEGVEGIAKIREKTKEKRQNHSGHG